MDRITLALVTTAAASLAALYLTRRLLTVRHRPKQRTRTATELDTPTLLVDLDALEHNIQAFAKFASQRGLLWRPHCKAVRCAEIALRMIQAGACGVTCAKVSQAAALADGGVRDILIANEVVGAQKIAALVELARRAVVCVAVDDAANLRDISAAAARGGARVAVLVDVDCGMGRCGVPWEDTETIVGLCRLAAALPGVSLRGLMGYDGHTQSGDATARRDADAFAQRLSGVRAAVEAAGVAVGVVSGGGSGNYCRAAQLGAISELQAGGGVFHCQAYQAFERNWREAREAEGAMPPREGGDAPRMRPCLHVLTQVVSRATPGRVVADAGFKAAGGTGAPVCVSHPGLTVRDVNAEHMILADDHPPLTAPPVVPGTRLLLVPGYSDAATLLHRAIYGVRGGHGTSTRQGHTADVAKMVVECEFDLRPSMGALF